MVLDTLSNAQHYYSLNPHVEVAFRFLLENDLLALPAGKVELDGDNVYAPKIGRWNTHSPGRVKASGNVLCVEFRSDCATTEAGWEASWQAVMPLPPAPEIEDGVYPNPTTGEFTVRTEDMGYGHVAVYDLYGNQMVPLMRYFQSVTIDASAWPAGVYIVNSGAPVTMGKVVKLVKF